MMVLMACAFLFLQAEPSSPVAPGGIREFLTTRTEEGLREDAQRVAVLGVLEELPSTADYLGTVVARAIDADLKKLIQQDLRYAAWADLNCVPGEAAVVGTGLKRARRFKEISLPVLASICRESGGDFIEKRAREHALRAAKQIMAATSDAAGLKERLAKATDRESLAILFEEEK